MGGHTRKRDFGGSAGQRITEVKSVEKQIKKKINYTYYASYFCKL